MVIFGKHDTKSSIVLNGPTTFSNTFSKTWFEWKFYLRGEIGNTRNSCYSHISTQWFVLHHLWSLRYNVYRFISAYSWWISARFDSVGNCLWQGTVISPNTSAYIKLHLLMMILFYQEYLNSWHLNIADTIFIILVKEILMDFWLELIVPVKWSGSTNWFS